MTTHLRLCKHDLFTANLVSRIATERNRRSLVHEVDFGSPIVLSALLSALRGAVRRSFGQRRRRPRAAGAAARAAGDAYATAAPLHRPSGGGGWTVFIGGMQDKSPRKPLSPWTYRCPRGLVVGLHRVRLASSHSRPAQGSPLLQQCNPWSANNLLALNQTDP